MFFSPKYRLQVNSHLNYMVLTERFSQTVSDIRICAMSNQLATEECHQYIKYDTFYKAKAGIKAVK